MPRYLPVCLDLTGRRALVVGGGAMATERVRDLLACGAVVTVVSPEASEAIRAAAEAGTLTWHRRRYRRGDTRDAFLVICATNDPETNAAVFQHAAEEGRLVNVCDDPEHCNMIFASRIERGPLTLSIFTHGTSPALSRRVRRELEAWLGPEYGELASWLAELRPRIKAIEGLTQPERQRVFERVVYSEVLLLLREGRRDDARALFDRLVAEELERLAARKAPPADPTGIGTGAQD